MTFIPVMLIALSLTGLLVGVFFVVYSSRKRAAFSLRVLECVVQHPNCTVDDIGKCVTLDAETVTVALNRLRAEGKVERRFEEETRLMLHRSVDAARPLGLFERQVGIRERMQAGQSRPTWS
ncbi:MarR family transcriptional regulator [Streptomyces massasporeus]|uniref:MarR family transcriptional regulator n=1 Tax=Streptomyces massasporeus TaxID=67324 RepID=UPI00378B1D9C